MSLLYCDSFATYTTMSQRWSPVGGGVAIVAAGGRFGGNAVLFNPQGGGDYSMQRDLATAITTWIFGFAIKLNVTPSASAPGMKLVRLVDVPTGATHCFVTITNTGVIAVYRGDGTLLGDSGAYTMPADAVYRYMEIKLTIDNTAGVAVVKVDASTKINLSSVDTQNGTNASATAFKLGDTAANANNVMHWADLYVCSGTGSVNNDFLGDVRVSALTPTGAGNSTQFTPSAGSNFQCVDEVPPNDDTDYVSDATVGHVDLYAMSDLPNTTGGIKGIQTVFRARKDDAGTRQIRSRVRSSASESTGATQTMSASYATFLDIIENDPSTATAWTPSGVNGMQAGVEVVA